MPEFREMLFYSFPCPSTWGKKMRKGYEPIWEDNNNNKVWWQSFFLTTEIREIWRVVLHPSWVPLAFSYLRCKLSQSSGSRHLQQFPLHWFPISLSLYPLFIFVYANLMNMNWNNCDPCGGIMSVEDIIVKVMTCKREDPMKNSTNPNLQLLELFHTVVVTWWIL